MRQLATTGTLLKGETSLSVAKPIAVHTSRQPEAAETEALQLTDLTV